MHCEMIFFELLQVSVGNRRSLSVVPTMEQWTELLAIAQKQSLIGISYKGVSDLCIAESGRQVLGLPPGVRVQWLGMSAKIQQSNKYMNERCTKVCNELEHNGFKTIVLKGQSNAAYYPETLRNLRTPGDIDVWVRSPCGIDIAVGNDKGAEYVTYYGKEAIVEYAKLLARVNGRCNNLTIRYHHVDLHFDGKTEVEAHFMPMYLNNPFLNRRLQKFFEEKGELCSFQLTDSSIIPMGTVSFNVIYQLTHINKHLFEEGVGLRQLMDYYFVLRALHVEQGSLADRTQSMAQWAEGMGMSVMSNEEIMHELDRFGLRKFAGAVMWVLAQVFEPNQDSCKERAACSGKLPYPWMICEPDEVRGRHLLDEVMLAGNMGAYDPRKGDLTHETALHKFFRKTKRNLALAKYYPHEALWEPVFRVYHWFWRKSFCLS